MVSLGATEVKILAYADDVAVFCEDRKSVTRAVTPVKQFCEASGASVNWDKCCGVWHGAWATAPSECEGVLWSDAPSKYLGVPLQHSRNSNMHWSGGSDRPRQPGFAMEAPRLVCF